MYYICLFNRLSDIFLVNMWLKINIENKKDHNTNGVEEKRILEIFEGSEVLWTGDAHQKTRLSIYSQPITSFVHFLHFFSIQVLFRLINHKTKSHFLPLFLLILFTFINPQISPPLPFQIFFFLPIHPLPIIP